MSVPSIPRRPCRRADASLPHLQHIEREQGPEPEFLCDGYGSRDSEVTPVAAEVPLPPTKQSTFVHDTAWDKEAIAVERERRQSVVGPVVWQDCVVLGRHNPYASDHAERQCPIETGWTEENIHLHRESSTFDREPIVPIEPTKTREGDQVLPRGTGDCVQDRIIADMHESKRVGTERYGDVLRTFNGRSTLQDIHEEVRDLHVYLTQIRIEAEADRGELIRVVHQALWDELPEIGDVLRRRGEHIAETAVDRIMGWVIGQRLAGGPDAISIVLDAMKAAQHAGKTNQECAELIVSCLRAEQAR